MGGMVLANNHEYQENSYPVPAWGVGLVVMCMRFSVVFIGRACVAGLVGVLHEVSGAIEKELGPSAVCLKSEAASHSPKENRPGHAGVESEELQVVRSQLRGDEACDAMYPLGHLPESTRYKAHDSSRVVGVELGFDWSDLVGWGAELRIKVLGRGAVLLRDFGLPFVGNCGKLG